VPLSTERNGAGLTYASYSSLLGDIFVLSSTGGLLASCLGSSEEAFLESSLKEYGAVARKKPAGFSELFSLFDDYFTGKKVDFVVELKPVGSPFEQGVWQALRTIPYNQCRSYSWVAAAAARTANGGSPKAYRAVGRACGRNRLPIIIPCHRVVMASGAIGGFAEAAGGVQMKRRLLELEGVTLPFK